MQLAIKIGGAMSESNFWDRVRNGVKLVKPKAELDRVENMVMAGMPDVNFLIDLREGWMELKQIDKEPARGGKVFGDGGLRDAQVLWIHRRWKKGGNVHIVSQVGKYIFVHKGHCAKDFNEMTLENLLSSCSFYHRGANCDWLGFIDSLNR